MPRGMITTSDVQFFVDEIEVHLRHEEINKGIVRVITNSIPPTFSLGTSVSLVESESMNTLLAGRISAIRDSKVGKDVNEFEIEVRGNEEILDNLYTSLPPATLTQKQWINSIVGDYSYSKTFYGDFSKTVYFEPPKSYQTRFNLLKDFCSKNKIFFYFDNQGNIVFYKDTIEVVNSTIEVVFEKERVEDISPVRNSITILGKYVALAKDEDLEDLSLWSSYDRVYDKWYAIVDSQCKYVMGGQEWHEDSLIEKDTVKVISGSFSLKKIKTFECEESSIIDAYKRTWTTREGFVPRIVFQCSLPQSFVIDDLTYLQICAAIKYTNDNDYQCPTKLNVVLLKNPTEVTYDNMYRKPYWQWSNTLTTLNGEWNTVVLSRNSFEKSPYYADYRTIRYIDIAFVPDIVPCKINNVTDIECWIDNIVIATKGTIQVSIPESINKYGIREFEPIEFTEFVIKPEDMQTAASLVLERYSEPEISLRRLTTTFDVTRGKAYYVQTDKGISLWKVEEITHFITENKWNKECLLSHSPGETGEKTQREIFRKIFYYLKGKGLSRISFLSPGINYFRDVRIKELIVEDSANFWHCTIGWIDAEQVKINSVGLINSLDTNYAYIGTIGSLHQLNVEIASIGLIEHADEIHATDLYIGSISSLNQLIVDIADIGKIQNVNTISHVGIMNVDEIQSVGQISNAGIIITGSLQANTITNVDFLSAAIANIEKIENVDYLNVLGNAEIATIHNVQKGYFIDTSISHLSHVDTAYIIDATIYTGTITSVTIATATIDLALFKEATISNVDIKAGNISNVIFSSCTINDVTISVATISQLEITNNLIGEGIIKAEHIDELAIKFEKLDLGIQKVLGSTLWEAENLSYGNGGYVVDDPTASNGRAVQCTVATDPEYFVFGPYKTLSPGDYFVHFRVKGEKQFLFVDYFVLDVYDQTSDKVLVSKTLSMADVYEDFPNWRVFTLLAPNISAGHTIETRVKLLIDHTLTVDYVKVEPAGAFVNYPFYFKIDTEHIEDFAITGSKIASLSITSGHIKDFEIDSSKIASLAIDTYHIKNFAIKNAHIDTLQITYDRLVKPPIGWNEVLNPSFEYGMWEQWTGTDASFGRVKDDNAHCGEYVAKIVYTNESPSGKYGNVSEWILLNPSENTLVVSSWIKANLQEGYACSWIRFFDSNKNQISVVDFNTIHGPYNTNGWRLDYVTISIPANAKYARVGLWANTLVKATIYFDDISLVYGDQYTGFIDTTVARNRWLPDTYSRIERNEWDWYVPGTYFTISCLTLPLTIDYRAKAMIFAGINLYFAKYLNPGETSGSRIEIRLVCDGQTIAVKRTEIGEHNFSDEAGYFGKFRNVNFVDEATLDVGEHTLTLDIVSYRELSIYPDYIDIHERYISVLAGSYFES